MFPPGDAREDWAIIRAVSGAVGKSLGFDTLVELRESLYAAYPHFADVDQIAPPNGHHLEGGPSYLTCRLHMRFNTYMTCAISRASQTMAECTLPGALIMMPQLQRSDGNDEFYISGLDFGAWLDGY